MMGNFRKTEIIINPPCKGLIALLFRERFSSTLGVLALAGTFVPLSSESVLDKLSPGFVMDVRITLDF